MADTRQILDEAGLDFVYKDGAVRHQESDDLVATIRGDLEQVSLPDIFQTLTMSAMEGTLRITQGFDPTYVHFSSGQVRVLAPEELQARRLGNRLVTSGLLEPKEVRQAFVKARKESRPLADVLEETGKIEKVQYDAIRLALEEDFLLELFTLHRGAFAFFKESFPIPGLEERFEQCMVFETEQVLLEIARRADEWVTILETVGDLDELFVRTGTSFPSSDDLSGDLYAQIDGKRTLRDIAGGLLDALFDVAKAAKWLLDNECIERAPANHLLNLAREAIDEQQLRRSLFYLRLVSENRRTRPDQLEEVASLFVQAGDHRAGADVLLRLVSKVNDPERQYELLVQARGLDGLNVAVLEGLVQALSQTAVAGEDEYDDAVDSLCEIYIDLERFEEALVLCEELELAHPADLNLASRKALILRNLGRADDGIAHLERLKEVYRFQKNTEGHAKTLEQILRLDPRNAKARVELRTLKESKSIRRLRQLGLALILVIVGRVGWSFWANWRATEVAQADLVRVEKLLEDGKVIEAKKLAENITGRDVDDDIVQKAVHLLENAKKRFAAAAAAKHAELVAAFQLEMGEAVTLLEQNKWKDSLARYDGVQKKFSGLKGAMQRIRASLETRFKTLDEELKEEIESFQGAGIASPKSTESAADRKRLLARMERWFPLARLQAAKELLDAHHQKQIVTPVPLPKKLVGRITTYLGIGDQHRARRTQLAAQIQQDAKTEDLNKFFVAAQECEKRYDFEGAAKRYADLAKSYEGDAETRQLFERKRDRYEAILAGVRELEAATDKGDHELAIQHLTGLRKKWDDIPFETLVALPLRIESSPQGATVFDGDKELGKTPIVVRYAPGNRMELRLELAGFFPVEAPESVEDKGRYSTIFEARPRAEASFEGSTTRPGVTIAKRYIASDRKGTLKGFDPKTGKEEWSRSTNDLSGDLGGMLHLVNKVVVTSPTGRVVAISPMTGEEVWQHDLDTRLNTPAMHLGGEVFVLGRDGTMHIGDPLTGKFGEKLELGHTTRYAPLLLSKERFAILDDASTLRVYDKKGVEIWSEEITDSGWSPPTRNGDRILIVAGARFEARNVADGSLAWSKTLPTTPRLGIAQHENRIALVVGNRNLVLLDASNGEVVARRQLADRPSATPCLLPEGVLVPLESGGTLLLDAKKLAVVSILSSDLTTEIFPHIVGSELILLSGNNGKIRVFDRALLSRR